MTNDDLRTIFEEKRSLLKKLSVTKSQQLNHCWRKEGGGNFKFLNKGCSAGFAGTIYWHDRN